MRDEEHREHRDLIEAARRQAAAADQPTTDPDVSERPVDYYRAW